MKSLNVLKVAILALPLLVASCGTKKKAVKKAFKNYAGKKNLVFA